MRRKKITSNFESALTWALLHFSIKMEREKRIASILENANTTGFTELLKGDRIKRHVVAFTDNGEWSIELLAAQASFF